MSEEQTMFEEVSSWIVVMRRLRRMAIEMQSHEQDADYITNDVVKLFRQFEKLEPDEDGLAGRYGVDFQHPDNPDYKLCFEFKAWFESNKTS